jgi:ribosomal protein L21
MVYKKKRRKGYEKRYGHRQPYTEVKITKINA